MEIWELGATRQAAAIRSRELSSREVVSTLLERIEAVNPAVNALRARGAGAGSIRKVRPRCPSDRFIPIGRRGRRAQGRGSASAMTAATRSTRRRLAAICAVLVGAATIVLAVAVAIGNFPRGLFLTACVVLAGIAGWYAVLRKGTLRVAGLTVAALALGGAVALLVAGGSVLDELLVLVGLVVTVGAARATLAVHVQLPDATAPRRAVLFFNPRSGGGKAERFKLADEARARGIEPVELSPRARTSRCSCARPSRAARTAWRWPAVMVRRPSWRRSRPSTACRTRASPPARATTSRSTWA